jgi:hypothetical protein
MPRIDADLGGLNWNDGEEFSLTTSPRLLEALVLHSHDLSDNQPRSRLPGEQAVPLLAA